MDLETKKKIPRKLRGAGVRRSPCPFCDSFHSSPNGKLYCDKNPDAEANREKAREAMRRAKPKPVTRKTLDLLDHYNRERWANPENRVKLSKIMKKKSSFLGKDQSGPNNPMWGKKHSPETRAKMSMAVRKSLPKVDRPNTESYAPRTSATASDFFSQGKSGERSGGDLWFDVD